MPFKLTVLQGPVMHFTFKHLQFFPVGGCFQSNFFRDYY